MMKMKRPNRYPYSKSQWVEENYIFLTSRNTILVRLHGVGEMQSSIYYVSKRRTVLKI